MKSFLIILLSLTFTILSSAQKKSAVDCKAMLNVDQIIENVDKTHYIFTGTDTTGLNVKVTKITVMEARREMVKRRDKNCTAIDPKDCYISVMEEIPPVTMNLYTLAGPDQTTEYETRTEKVKTVKREAGQQEVSIVCVKNRSKALVNKIQTALISKGYPLTVNGILDQATKLSIEDFQRENKMAYGDLTLEVLAVLGVR